MNHDLTLGKAAIYLRSASAGGGDSVASQRESLTREAVSQGLEVVAVYADVGCSGRTRNPQPRQLLRDAKAGNFQHLLVHDCTRLSRGSVSALFSLVDEPRSYGVTVRSHAERLVMV